MPQPPPVPHLTSNQKEVQLSLYLQVASSDHARSIKEQKATCSASAQTTNKQSADSVLAVEHVAGQILACCI